MRHVQVDFRKINIIKEDWGYQNFLRYDNPIYLFKPSGIPEQHRFVSLAAVRLELISWLRETVDEVYLSEFLMLSYIVCSRPNYKYIKVMCN